MEAQTTESETMAQLEERKKIAARMRALAAMTVENGCSEEEANSAISLLASLQSKYNMTLDPDEIRGNGVTMAGIPNITNETVFHAVAAIAKATDCEAVISGEIKTVLFFGTKHDTEYAVYLFAIVHKSAETLFNNYIFTPEYQAHRKNKIPEHQIRLSYTFGVVERLKNRILMMLKPLDQESTTGQEIMVIKSNKNKAAVNELGLGESTAVSKELAILSDVAEEGKKAADNVQLVDGLAHNANSNPRLN